MCRREMRLTGHLWKERATESNKNCLVLHCINVEKAHDLLLKKSFQPMVMVCTTLIMTDMDSTWCQAHHPICGWVFFLCLSAHSLHGDGFPPCPGTLTRYGDISIACFLLVQLETGVATATLLNESTLAQVGVGWYCGQSSG
jgi:hypothetical protein